MYVCNVCNVERKKNGYLIYFVLFIVASIYDITHRRLLNRYTLD